MLISGNQAMKKAPLAALAMSLGAATSTHTEKPTAPQTELIINLAVITASGQPPEHGLPQHPHERVSAVLAGAGVREPLAGHRTEAERIVEFAVSEQTRIGGYDRTAKLKRQPAVEIKPETLAIRFTRRVRHDISFQISLTC